MVGREEEEALYHAEDGGGGEVIVNFSATMVGTTNNGVNSKIFLFLAACTGNLASFFCGTALGWTSPEVPKLKGTDDNPLSETVTATQEGWIGSFLPLAAAIGPLAAGTMSDKLGRKKSLLISAVPFIIAFILNVFANNVYYFYASRFLCGLGTGIIFTVLPTYIAEIADDASRSTLGSLLQLFICFGLLFSYSLGPYLSFTLFNIILVVTPIAFVLMFLLFIPDSPYYLVLSKNSQAAEDALCKLRSKSAIDVQKEMEMINMQVRDARENKAGVFDIFKSKGLRKALMISVGLISFQQFSGINVVLFYTQDIFTDAGVSLAPELCTILIGVVQIFGSFVTPALVDKKGKRFLLMTSGLGMTISLAVLAYFFYLKDDKHSDVANIGWLPIACLIVYIFTYCFGFGSLPWAVAGELFPGNVKSSSSTITASACWLQGFLLTNYFNVLTSLIGKSFSFGIFAVCCALAIGFVFKFVPETTGKSLQEIQDILNGNSDTKE